MEKCVSHYWLLQGLLFLIVSMLPAKSFYQFTSSSNQVYLNQTGVINIPHTWQLKSDTGLSFRTCSNGKLLHQVGANGNSLTLSIDDGALQVQWTLKSTSPSIKAGQNFTDKVWYYVSLDFSLGSLQLKVLKGSQVLLDKLIANSTYNNELWDINLDGGTPLQVGIDFTGCIMPGPNVNFTNSNFTAGVILGNCSLLDQQNCVNADKDFDDCYSFPCKNQGTCVDQYKNYTCNCLPIYSGRNCETDLSSQGCNIGPCQNNATCIPSGSGFKCVCQSGFTGQYCMIDINECSSQPCAHGTCIDRINGVECNCTGSGYQGPTCSENVDECVTSNPCGNGTCSDTIGSFICRCPRGFSGSLCSQEIDECLSDPCQNGGTCQNLIGSFKCHCASGFEGTFCEINTPDCLSNSCPWANNICVDQINNFTCRCKDGYTGRPESCEDIDECAVTPCANNASCINLENNYRCRCLQGFDGINCTNNIDECRTNPCHNNATCVDGINSYTCNCLAGFTGSTCQVNINDCKNDSCEYGICTDMVQGFKCTCVQGWTGERCDKDFDECLLKPCQNGANCTNLSNDYKCSCTAGYAGKNCSIDIDDCQMSPCQNQGTCIDLVNGYRCNCTDDWMGTNCTQVYDACSFAPCQNNGNCSAPWRSHDYTCVCFTGFKGAHCEVNIDDCVNVTCTDGKICYDHINGYECACPKGKTGKGCLEDIDECLKSPCQNSGTCVNTIGGYYCKCPYKIASIDSDPALRFPTGFNGTHCEHDINECNIRVNNHGICLNGGTCRNLQGDFTCHCDSSGKDGGNYYGGRNCEVVLDYCRIKEQCQNNATCSPTSSIKKYVCHCLSGFTGRHCEINIDDCVSQPCRYNGTCVDGINSYTCLCPNGTKGKNCEMNIDECISNPCQNNGTCKDLLNGRHLDDPLRYHCNCSDTGFKGDFCQHNIDDCVSNPCKNDGTCIDGIKEYSCKCHEGYRGKQCEEDIDECTSQPCVHAIKCIQRSNQSLYGPRSTYPGFSKFTYGNASGYYCLCDLGYEGTNCDENIDDCVNHACRYNATCNDAIGYYNCTCKPGYKGFFCEDDIDECKLPQTPCMQGSKCTNEFGSYNCNCVRKTKPWYGGKNCSVELTACRKQPCQNDGKCDPLLVDGIHDYKCQCNPGFTGKNCTVSTSLSFNGQSYLQFTGTPMKRRETSFRFRTTWSEGFLASFPLRDNECVTTEIKDSHLVLGINGTYHTVSTNNVNDATWQLVNIHLDTKRILFKLVGTGCQSPNCFKSQMISHPTTGEVSFGKIHIAMNRSTKMPYIGCFEDITIDGKYLLPGYNTITEMVNVSQGCHRQLQCFPGTCSYRGACIDLWIRFRCVCERPFYGDICQEEVTAATFSPENSNSFVEYSLISLQDSLQTNLDFSFFFTTRRRNSLIVYFVDDPDSLKNNSSNVSPSFFSLLLQDGKVVANLNWCNFSIPYKTPREYANGERHFLKVLITTKKFHLHVDELKAELPLQKTCIFNASTLYVGQVPVDSSANVRVRRSTTTTGTNIGSILPFKGVIQDMNLNNVFLMLNDNSTNKIRKNEKILKPLNYSNVLSGLNTDDVCKNQMPCQANSTCKNVFYNDFECNCTRGFTGKDCSNIDYCLSILCEGGSECKNAPDGYECMREATFNITSYINFQANSKLPEPKNLSLEFRTREADGFLIKADNLDIGLHFVLQLQDGMLLVGSSESLIFNSSLPVNDGYWHSFFIEKNSDTKFTVKITNLKQMITVVNSSISTFPNGIQDNRTIISIGRSFDGCMRGLYIDTNFLPFDPINRNSTSSLAYGIVKKHDVVLGCKGDNVCASWYHQCKNGATCIDKWNKYICQCATGYEGDLCQNNIDDCKQNNCEHGATCVDGLNMYKCLCAPGYKGSRCQTNIDECKILPNCRNNGTCTDLVNGYNCTCTERFTGDNCEFKINQTCDTLTCKNGTCTKQNYTNHLGHIYEVVNCTCDAGFEGQECEFEINFCENVTCQNNGNCSANKARTGFQCNCDNDHEGIYCEKKIDHCASSPCLNGATCTDLVGKFSCQCEYGWKGKTCKEDIDECKNRTEWCFNNGVCTNLPGSFDCNCTGTGYGGYLCADDIDECHLPEGSPCKHNASCDNLPGSYFCDCGEDSGYEGKNCDVPNCQNIHCAFNSTCFETEKEWFCLCPKYYEGPRCQYKGLCTDNPCENNAVCTQNYTAHSYKCECTSGFKGQNCSEDINECNVNPCMNGKCINSFGSYRCDCDTLKFLGKNCHILNPCSPERNPCMNSANCTYNIIGNNASANCICPDGWQGQICAEKLVAGMDMNNLYLYIGIPLALIILGIIIGIVFFVLSARKKRATSGTYSPSRQEMSGSRVELGNVMKIPPTERLI